MRPRWVLAAIVIASAVLYAWNLGERPVAEYYAAAVRTMSGSWTATLFGAVDPAESITLDKIPGAFWPQVVSVRIFGFHPWALVLPQVIATIATVLVLYRAVSRHAGQAAGLYAAAAMAVTPAVTVLAHSNWPDSTLVLLLVLAADATGRAITGGRLRDLLLAGLWVGLAVHAKMLVAWAVLPALGIAYLLAAPGRPARRLGHLAAATGVTAAVSSIWLLVVWLTPSGRRPYVDATTDDNPFDMVFGYNGLDRFTGTRFTADDGPWGAVFGWMAPQGLWLFPLAALAVVAGLVLRRGEPRTDPVRAGLVLWGAWLATFVVVFSAGHVNHSCYAILLAPAIAALAGSGIALFRGSPLLPAGVALTVAWTVVLSARHPDFLSWLVPVVLVAGVLAVAALVVARQRVTLPVAAAAAATLLIAPAAWSVSTTDIAYSGISVNPEAGPFGNGAEHLADPEQARALAEMRSQLHVPEMREALFGRMPLSVADRAALRYAEDRSGGSRYVLAVPGSHRAALIVLHTGASVLPVGGFTGTAPFPGVDRLERLIRERHLRFVLTDGRSPEGGWVAGRCAPVDPADYGAPQPGMPPPGGMPGAPPGAAEKLYDCASVQNAG